MAQKKQKQKKNVPTVYMRPLDDEVLEQYIQSTFVLKKDTLTKEKHIVQSIHQEVQQDAKNIEEPKEQLEENVAEFKERPEENEKGIEESKEQPKENAYRVVEFKEQLEENEAEQVEEVQKNIVSNDQDRGKSDAEVQDDKRKAVPFQEMTNEEKIYYLLNRPHYIPKANCFIRTNRTSYIGYITSYENEVVTIKSPTKLMETAIDINEITIIQMIGT